MPRETDYTSVGRSESSRPFLQQIMEKTIADPTVIEMFPEQARKLLMHWVDGNEGTLADALEWEASNEDQQAQS